MRRWRSWRRAVLRRPSTAWRTSACGVTRRPAPSSLSNPAATASSAASSTSSASSSVAATSTGNVDSRSATADRATTLAARRGQAVEARREHGPDRVGHLRAGAVLAHPAGDDLAHEERVAARHRAQLGGAGAGPFGELEEVADGVVVERADVDAGEVAVAGQAHQETVELRVRCLRRDALRDEDHHAARALVAQDVLEQLDGRGVGPLHVVDHEQDRGDRRLHGEQVGDGLEQQVALHVGRRALGAHRRHELRELGQQHGHRAALGDDPLPSPRRQRVEGRPQRLHEGLERHDRVLRGASPQHGGALGLQRGGEVAGERRLARPGLPHHDGEARRAAEGGVPHLAEPPDEVGASDERRRRGPAPRPRAAAGRVAPPSVRRTWSRPARQARRAVARRRAAPVRPATGRGRGSPAAAPAAPGWDRARARRRAAPVSSRTRAGRRPAGPSGRGRA